MAGEEGEYAAGVVEEEIASMRPRLGGRGRDQRIHARPKRRLPIASMRPRLGGRGRGPSRTPASPPPSGFNEAPARWPGKRARRVVHDNMHV